MGEAVSYAACLIVLVWVLFMIAFRPEEWQRYCDDNKARNRKLLDGGLKVGKLLWGAYTRGRK